MDCIYKTGVYDEKSVQDDLISLRSPNIILHLPYFFLLTAVVMCVNEGHPDSSLLSSLSYQYLPLYSSTF